MAAANGFGHFWAHKIKSSTFPCEWVSENQIKVKSGTTAHEKSLSCVVMCVFDSLFTIKSRVALTQLAENPYFDVVMKILLLIRELNSDAIFSVRTLLFRMLPADAKFMAELSNSVKVIASYGLLLTVHESWLAAVFFLHCLVQFISWCVLTNNEFLCLRLCMNHQLKQLLFGSAAYFRVYPLCFQLILSTKDLAAHTHVWQAV